MRITPCCIALLFASHVTPGSSAEPPVRPGDRIAIVGNTFADQLRIHGYLETLLLQHWKDDSVSVRNLGWGGDMLSARDRPTGFPSEASTLTAHQTDVIIACFGMGESFAGEKGLTEFKNDLEAFIAEHAGKKYNGESEVRLILVSPIAQEDLGELTPAREQRNRELKAYTRAMAEVAASKKTPFVDLFEPSLYLMDERAGPNLTTNGIHLTPFGHWAISHTFLTQLIKGAPSPGERPWQLRVDLRTGSAEALGVSIFKLTANDTEISFQVLEESAPSLPPPTGDPLPPQLEEQRDTLSVNGLKPGTYELKVDGKSVAIANEKGWSEGVAIDSTPAHSAVEAYRAAVNEKNLQFTYSWKALNQVHIVGERRKSPSGRALPKEVIEFGKLADQLDADLRNGIESKTRLWVLSRIKQ